MNWFQKVFNRIGVEKGLGYVTIGNIISTALGALLWFILASLMAAENYGELNYHISIATILTASGILGFDYTLTTFLAKGFQRVAQEASTLVGLSAIPLFLLIFLVFSSASTGLVLLGMMFFTLSTAELLGRHRYKEFMFVMILQRLATLAFVPILFLSMNIDGALYGYALSYLPLSYRFFVLLKGITISFTVLKSNKTFFLHSYGTGISRTLVHFSDKLVIAPLFGLAILGYYQFGLQVLAVISIIPTILYNYLLPQEASGKNSNSYKVKVLGISTSIIMTFALILLVPIIIQELFPQFERSILPTQIVLFSGPALTMVSIYSSTFLAKEKSFHVLVSAGIFLGVQYSLLAILGNTFGLEGLSMATLIASFSQMLFLMLIKKFAQDKDTHKESKGPS